MRERLEGIAGDLTRAANDSQQEIDRAWRLYGELERVQRRLAGRKRVKTA